jgi:uncharacterized protein YceK
MKYILLGVVAVLMTGCGQIDRMAAAATGYSTICVEGVKYIQFTSGATAMYDRTGRIVLCN